MERFLICVAVAAFAFIWRPDGTPFPATQPQIIVIGGGVAGLTAAAALHRSARYNVTLLEAMDRIGGRTHTLRVGEAGYYVEMGGEWVHGEEGNPVFEVAHPLGLLQTTADPPFEPYEFRFQDGRVLDGDMAQALEDLYEDLYKGPQEWARSLRGLSLGLHAKIVLEEHTKSRRLKWDQAFQGVALDLLHRRLLEESSADNWFETSANDQCAILGGRENVTWRPPHGYSALHRLILTGKVEGGHQQEFLELPDWVQLNKEVTRIDYTDAAAAGKVGVCTQDGACLEADHVIYTPSLGVLKATHEGMFTPPLRVKKALTIEHIGFGSATKLYVEFGAPWWPSNYSGTYLLWDQLEGYWRSNVTLEELQTDVDGLPLWTRAISRIFTVDSRSHPSMLRAWVTGPAAKAVEVMATPLLQKTIMGLIRRFLGQQIPDPMGVHVSRWWSNPFTRGTYSYTTLVSDRHAWTLDLAEPIEVGEKPLVCFAGEATDARFFSTVHGAYNSGLREAARIEAWYEREQRNWMARFLNF